MKLFIRDPVITFSCAPELKGVIPDPIPAAQAIPKWFKKMPEYEGIDSLKKCIPFKDAMTMGYILPLWIDLKVTNENNKIFFSYPSNGVLPVVFEDHNVAQIEGCPMRKSAYGDQPMKFVNPWVITTPVGYSCLFIQPINHFDNKLNIITGVVDTDKYNNYVNFPFLWMDTEFNGLIPKGTPLVQVIPFKRDRWSNVVKEINTASSLAINKTHKIVQSVYANAYRLNWWSPKRYK